MEVEGERKEQVQERDDEGDSYDQMNGDDDSQEKQLKQTIIELEDKIAF